MPEERKLITFASEDKQMYAVLRSVLVGYKVSVLNHCYLLTKAGGEIKVTRDVLNKVKALMRWGR